MIQIDEKIKVLHIVGGMEAAGIETLVMNIYRNIDRQKYHFDFVVHTKKEGFYDKEILELGGRILQHPNPSESITKYSKTLKKTIDKYGPYDAIHSHTLFFSGVPLKIAKKSRIPIRIAHSHSTNNSRKKSMFRNFYEKYMQHLILKNANFFFGCSEEACEYVFGKDCWNDNRVEYLPNAIDITPYKKIKREMDLIDKNNDLYFHETDTIIGHIGRFTKSKNHLFIIDLFEEFLKTRKNSHLLLAGEGEEKERVKEYVNKKELSTNVHFLGVRKDIPNLLSKLDLFLLPSLYEGLGIVLIEAQAAGIPSVVSDRIPNEADINIGLVSTLNLEANKKEWISQMIKASKINKPDWKTREAALKKNGYDIMNMVEKLSAVYSSNVNV